jgi:hypothetical protein
MQWSSEKRNLSVFPFPQEKEEAKPSEPIVITALPNICFTCALARLETGRRAGGW